MRHATVLLALLALGPSVVAGQTQRALEAYRSCYAVTANQRGLDACTYFIDNFRVYTTEAYGGYDDLAAAHRERARMLFQLNRGDRGRSDLYAATTAYRRACETNPGRHRGQVDISNPEWIRLPPDPKQWCESALAVAIIFCWVHDLDEACRAVPAWAFTNCASAREGRTPAAFYCPEGDEVVRGG